MADGLTHLFPLTLLFSFVASPSFILAFFLALFFFPFFLFPLAYLDYIYSTNNWALILSLSFYFSSFRFTSFIDDPRTVRTGHILHILLLHLIDTTLSSTLYPFSSFSNKYL